MSGVGAGDLRPRVLGQGPAGGPDRLRQRRRSATPRRRGRPAGARTGPRPRPAPNLGLGYARRRRRARLHGRRRRREHRRRPPLVAAAAQHADHGQRHRRLGQRPLGGRRQRPSTDGPRYTSWPSAGYLPAPLEPHGRWSFTAWDPDYDLSRGPRWPSPDRPASPRRSRQAPVDPAFGSLVFDVGTLARPAGAAADTYTVTRDAASSSGASRSAPYRYQRLAVRPRGRRPAGGRRSAAARRARGWWPDPPRHGARAGRCRRTTHLPVVPRPHGHPRRHRRHAGARHRRRRQRISVTATGTARRSGPRHR